MKFQNIRNFKKLKSLKQSQCTLPIAESKAEILAALSEVFRKTTD